MDELLYLISFIRRRVKKIKNIEKQIYEEIKSSSPDIIDSINNTGKLEEEIEKIEKYPGLKFYKEV